MGLGLVSAAEPEDPQDVEVGQANHDEDHGDHAHELCHQVGPELSGLSGKHILADGEDHLAHLARFDGYGNGDGYPVAGLHPLLAGKQAARWPPADQVGPLKRVVVVDQVALVVVEVHRGEDLLLGQERVQPRGDDLLLLEALVGFRGGNLAQ